jgi:hypothetical protein
MRRKLILVLITAIILVVAVVAVYLIRSAEPPGEISPLIAVDLESSVPLRSGNITQGMSFTLNLTINSLADKEMTFPLGLTLKDLENVGWLPPLDEATVFNSTFVPNPLVLQPCGQSFAFLTVRLADDAPLGTYVFNVELGNSEETHVEGISFLVDVSPK